MVFLSEIVNAMIQVIIFTAIPFLWWLIFARKKQNFFIWIGLKPIKSTDKKSLFASTLIIIILFISLSLFLLYLLEDVELATSEFLGLGIKGIPSALIYAFIKTSLSEEIIFRGFILKRLSNKIGFFFANMIQGILFGLLHGVIFFSFVTPIMTIIIIAFTGFIGCFMGYINEIKGSGSILPSWIIHGLSNTFSSLISLFSIL